MVYFQCLVAVILMAVILNAYFFMRHVEDKNNILFELSKGEIMKIRLILILVVLAVLAGGIAYVKHINGLNNTLTRENAKQEVVVDSMKTTVNELKESKVIDDKVQVDAKDETRAIDVRVTKKVVKLATTVEKIKDDPALTDPVAEQEALSEARINELWDVYCGEFPDNLQCKNVAVSTT